jgi:Zn-dependent peptidase ImmA (M78 family)
VTETNVFQLAQSGTFTDSLTEVLRHGARALLVRAVETEVAEFLGQHAELKTDDGRQRLVRHGHLPEREIMTGIGSVAVRQPRVRDRQPGRDGGRIRYTPTHLATLRAPLQEPRGADPDPLPQGRLDRRVRGGAGRARRQGCARPLGIDHWQSRRLPAEGKARYEPALRFQVRDAYERRQLALDLSASLDETPERFALKTSLQADAEAVGQQIRDFLGIRTADQKRARQPGGNYRMWRSHIEAKDILVFQIANLTTKQMLGMSLSFNELPVIAVNRKLTHNGRVFTLLHEFAHLMFGESGICDLSEDHLDSPQAQQTEIFANKVAATALLPKSDFLAESIVSARGQGQHEWSNDELGALAGTYGTSEETVLRRFLTWASHHLHFIKASGQSI